MKQTVRCAVIPVYLFLCLLIGGSAQGVFTNLALQLIAVVLIGWASVSQPLEEFSSAGRQLIGLAIVAGVMIVLQLLPLPPNIWSHLPGRDPVVHGFEILGYSLPALGISLTPYTTIATLLAALPAIAVLVSTVRIGQREWILASSIILATFAAVLLGALQVAGGGVDSDWYLYPITNNGAVGFFANRNHMGSLLVICIPFTVALYLSITSQGKTPSSNAAISIVGVGCLLLVGFGLVLNRSLAALGLAVPVFLLSGLLFRGGGRLRPIVLAVGGVSLMAVLTFLSASPLVGTLVGNDLLSLQSRFRIWNATIDHIQATFPWGTGLGSFPTIYRFGEDPSLVQSKYVNHAHNDYLEIVLELGLPGVILIVLFLAWWFRQTVWIWTSRVSSNYARAATIASGALLAHSTVDYPLRTAALSAVFAVCLAWMAQFQVPRAASAGDFRRPKHLSIN